MNSNALHRICAGLRKAGTLALLGLSTSWALALDIQPYSAERLAQLQSGGKPVAVHFHAEWCGTCKTQEKALLAIKSEGSLPQVTLLVADYDKEKDLRRKMKVAAQSTVLGGALQENRWAPVALGLGMASSFAALGLFVGTLGAELGVDSDSVRTVGGVLLLMLAGVLLLPGLQERFSLWMTPLATGAQNWSSRLSGASWASAFGLGAVLGLVWSPCSGPLLISALTLVASEGGAVRGVMILGGFGLGAALPLVAVAYASRAGFLRARNWLLAHIATLKKAFAALLAVMGVAILTGYDKVWEAAVLRILPEGWLRLTTWF
ncbi:MAG: hypothetical protein EBV28_05485 [Betaproteobacteria bacterium]|nr:hypothetical protein [Betaproteobacteria bacterium]